MNSHRILLALIVMICCVEPSHVAAQSPAASFTLIDYFQSVGRDSFFNGRLLTADDLSDEQQYLRSRERFLPDLDFPLNEIFEPAGMASVTLFFDEQAVASSLPSVPTNPDRPSADDFILLDDAAGPWRGRVFLPGFAGVYDVEGTFDNRVPEPNSCWLMLIGVTVLCTTALRRTRTRNPTMHSAVTNYSQRGTAMVPRHFPF